MFALDTEGLAVRHRHMPSSSLTVGAFRRCLCSAEAWSMEHLAVVASVGVVLSGHALIRPSCAARQRKLRPVHYPD